MRTRNVAAWASFAVAMTALFALFAGAVAFAIYSSRPAHLKPGAEWQHDHGSIYWTCTRDGHAMIRDADTGSTFLDRDDRKCDSGG